MAVPPAELAERTLAHYRDRFAAHGDTPLGVDWNGLHSQQVQFRQLLQLLPAEGRFTLTDFGCGYGALLDELDALPGGPGRIAYLGCDLNAEMIARARERYAGRSDVVFEVADSPPRESDFSVASGVFTLRLGRSDAQCAEDLEHALDALDRSSRHGFAFNCLTSYSDAEKMRDYLYYPDPCRLFDLCKRRYALNVALLHDYGLYACTLLVRKTLPT